MKLTDEQFGKIWETAKTMDGYDQNFFMQLYAKIFNDNLLVSENDLVIEIKNKWDEKFKQDTKKILVELSEWFKINTYDGCKIESFDLVKGTYGGLDIVPINPYVDESFKLDEKGDKFLNELSKKYGIRVGFVYWAYSK